MNRDSCASPAPRWTAASRSGWRSCPRGRARHKSMPSSTPSGERSKRSEALRTLAAGLEAVARREADQTRHVGQETDAGAAAALVVEREPGRFVPHVVDEAGDLPVF